LSRRISLALTLHNHQPVGNFGWVIADTYEHAYLPMLEALERHRGVQLALHYSGPLLAWLRSERPAFLERLGALVANGQVEIVGRRRRSARPSPPPSARPNRHEKQGGAFTSSC
jgi:alpha-amylase/alpha-mannosidase (GH57 family)